MSPHEYSDHLQNMDLSFHPLTNRLWHDFELLFGSHGACSGCWCMYWKLRGRAYSQNTGENTRQMQKNYVDSHAVPGLLAYADGYPVGWIAIEPRAAYPRLAHSRILKPLDSQPVWSITCFFVKHSHRRRGITLELIKAAVAHAAAQGAAIVEAYPVEVPPGVIHAAASIYTGAASAFRKAGFIEVARNSPTRPIFRLTLPPSPPQA